MKKLCVGGKMKRKSWLFVICYLSFIVLFLWGCGSGPGSPGSQGTEDTGVILEATIVPTYNGEDTYSVDAFQQVCSEGPPPKYEYFTDHQATVTITATLINPNTTFQPGTLYIEKYTVEFRRSADSIGAPPIQSDTRYKTIVITPPTGTGETTVTDTVILVDLLRKDQYATDVLSGQYSYGSAYINNYTAIYTFKGKNEYGDSFSFKAQTDFQIGSFDNCGG
jgi:hypothetical protein